mmetsp:Transcript_21412/g.47475  ORF Transcript_21412/g.47475 Transcript_21412/m.47475 type:complete len:258 (-) Transcript_21412:143-916(-)
MAVAPDKQAWKDTEGKDVESLIMDAKRPEYLDEAFLNVSVCCMGPLFVYCPCFKLSLFSTCFGAIVKCMANCFISLKKCIKCTWKLLLGCIMCPVLFICGLFKKCKDCFKKCLKCFMDCILKLCTPCFKICSPCTRCFRCCVKKIACLNCCNASCGLPCRNPPGCVCIAPCKLCGIGFSCPYFCCSCGTKHCLKMPKQEQMYWFDQKVSGAKAKEMIKAKKEERKAKKMGNTAELQKLKEENKLLREQNETLKLESA